MIKLTVLFEQGASVSGGGRVSGWTETWWNNMAIGSWNPGMSPLWAYRAEMLTDKAAIVGWRVQDDNGAVKVYKDLMPGRITTNADIPQMSLACKTTTADGSRTKYFRLRGLPDARTTDGVYVPLAAFYKAFTDWQQRLANDQWGWKGLVRTNPQVKLNGIDSSGNLTCAAGGTFAVGQTVIIRRAKNSNGQNVNGRYRILARTSDTAFQLANWIGGTVGAVGSVALYSSQLLLVGLDKTEFGDVTTQKVGRPFNLYRGRATKR